MFNRGRQQNPRRVAQRALRAARLRPAGRAVAGLGRLRRDYWTDSFFMENANLLKAPGYAAGQPQLPLRSQRASQLSRACGYSSRSRTCSTRPISRRPTTSPTHQCGDRASQNGRRVLANSGRVDLCRRAAQLYRRHQSEVLRMSGRRFTSFETRLGIAFGAPQNEGGLLMALKKDLIRRSSRSGRLEGRTTLTQRWATALTVFALAGPATRSSISTGARGRVATRRDWRVRGRRLRRSDRMARCGLPLPPAARSWSRIPTISAAILRRLSR